MTKPSERFKYPTEAFGRIPSFNSIDEEAEFWDTHDVSLFVGVEFKFVEECGSAKPTNTASTDAFHDQGRSDRP
jgi:hypothetical protein